MWLGYTLLAIIIDEENSDDSTDHNVLKEITFIEVLSQFSLSLLLVPTIFKVLCQKEPISAVQMKTYSDSFRAATKICLFLLFGNFTIDYGYIMGHVTTSNQLSAT